jgi:hypothetical protein
MTSSKGMESRPPSMDDLRDLCRALNLAKAKYIVIGGMAVLQHGFVRGTVDISRKVSMFERVTDSFHSGLGRFS